MFIPQTDLDWLREHADRKDDGTWACKETGAEIRQVTTGRSIWIRPFHGGGGEVWQVTHLFCPECNPNRMDGISYGTPIYEDELVER